MEALKNDVTRVKCVVPTAVAEFLLNKKRRDLVEFETRRNITIDIEGDDGLVPGESRIVCTP